MRTRINKWTAIFAGLFLLIFIVIPLLRDDIGLAQNPQNYMSQGWQESLQYLRSRLNVDQNAMYYQVYQKGEIIGIPYVLTWWDYGYWVVREAHMPVLCNPGGGERGMAARLFMNDNPSETLEILKAMNVKYIVIDSQMAVEKFYAVAQLAGLNVKDYYEYEGDRLYRTSSYYKTFLAQLFWFDARNVQGIERVFVSGSVKFGDEDISEVKVFEVQ